MLPPRPAGFRPGRYTLDQILFFSQSILDGFNKPRQGSRTILTTIDSSEAFDFVWSPALFRKLISAALLALLVGLNLSFLLGALAAWFVKITKIAPFESVEVFHKDPFLDLYFSLYTYINDLPAPLFPSASYSLYADDLPIWSSFSVPTAVEAT